MVSRAKALTDQCSTIAVKIRAAVDAVSRIQQDDGTIDCSLSVDEWDCCRFRALGSVLEMLDSLEEAGLLEEDTRVVVEEIREARGEVEQRRIPEGEGGRWTGMTENWNGVIREILTGNGMPTRISQMDCLVGGGERLQLTKTLNMFESPLEIQDRQTASVSSTPALHLSSTPPSPKQISCFFPSVFVDDTTT